MEYVEVKSEQEKKANDGPMTVVAAPQVPVPPAPSAPPAVTAPVPAQVQKTVEPIPPIPVYMDDDEQFVDFRKPGFWSYTPSVFSFAFGFVLFILFTVGGGGAGFLIGLGILVGLMLFVRYRLWNKTGYWFTNLKLVIHDGSRTRLIPYDEIALSSLAFEGQDCMFTTVYHQEIVLKGIVDMDQVVAFIGRKVKEARKVQNGKETGTVKKPTNGFS
jgi:hypothetical protein